MSQGYSEDLRERVLRFIEEGGQVKEAVRIFKVSPMSIHRWKKKKAATGCIKNKERTVWSRKVDLKELEAYIKANPDKMLSEIGEQFGVSASTIHRNLKKLRIVYKKSTRVCRA